MFEGTKSGVAKSGSLIDRFMAYLDEEGIIYKQMDDLTVRVGYTLDSKSDGVDIFLMFDEDGEPYVALRAWSIYEHKKSQLPEAYAECNVQNADWSWVKFYIDSDNEVVCSADAIVHEDTVGPELLELILRMVDIVDQAYPGFAKIDA